MMPNSVGMGLVGFIGQFEVYLLFFSVKFFLVIYQVRVSFDLLAPLLKTLRPQQFILSDRYFGIHVFRPEFMVILIV
jgi:hypothetical protein